MNIVFLLIQIIVGVFFFFKAKRETYKSTKVVLALLFAINGYGALSRAFSVVSGTPTNIPYITIVSVATVFFLNREKLISDNTFKEI